MAATIHNNSTSTRAYTEIKQAIRQGHTRFWPDKHTPADYE